MKLLAFDTSTDSMAIAVSDGERVWQHTGPGGAKASSTLIPAILELLGQAGLPLNQLDALAFGRGPGSFTGLRTACAVAQGLALGAGIPVLPVDTLLAVAEEARFEAGAPADLQVTAMLDARMDEIYVQQFVCNAGQWAAASACALIRPENLALSKDKVLAGNVFAVYASRLPPIPETVQRVTALPTATALLRLAPALLARGESVAAAHALPLYIRDKVALTTEERARIKADAAAVANG
ncbi:MAG TPA: tRNA (adenosine(37)-N6)-threonylcarbamoyltransferase complex dimerization subunit type 1 TsaB [Polaromonas sp.]|uniref:tRNA (adenosine(37)-N6)-threonylcarbamoyltransferase complex dimerization subunit type 1 TsaB n=1 Tax=Polaromonas sp. TaxID=1869339 RepID=UPI002D50FD87|nr:tRNA (adenosine(37)-N6)-threonylcarbamoyltransferase complex dimerization subunit type 1 TsaB [Polaromonas sp.]HYW55609.1 tRNA (adenosine(37)-N6)-threonylcarbamoyltransferase complex dimerization subunit type 1 TsaB [Polaromonas sp.]